MNHNNREFVTDNVDRERTKDNITYIRESLESAYEHCFGEAIEEYNAQQKRNDRKIDGVAGYMDKIRNSKNGEKLFYEILVQVGNMFDTHIGTPSGDVATKILDAYMRDFKANNPNIYVFNAVLHLDEQTPHLHIDYIPVAKGYKQGMMVRNSLDKALKQQGISGKATRFENSTIAWQNKEKDRIEVIMREYGLERAEETGLNRGHLTVDQFKAVAEQVSNEVASLPEQIESKPTLLDKDKVVVKKSDLEQLEYRAKLSVVHEEAISEAMKGVAKEKERAGARYEKAQGQLDNELRWAKSSNAVAYNARLAAERDREIAERERLRQGELRAEAERLVEEQQTLNARYSALQVENERLRNSVAEKQETISKLTAENTSLKAQFEAFKRDVSVTMELVKKPLQDKIEALESKVATLVESLDNACACWANTIKALNMLKYDKETDYAISGLTKKQSRLFDAIEKYAVKWFKHLERGDLADTVEKNIGISDGIQKEVKKLLAREDRGR